jgi:capsular exopolysaccharide synthesis family protein
MKGEVDESQRKLETFLRQHPVPEVQGSLAASVLLSRSQEQLATARSDLAKWRTKVDILNRFGPNALPEVLSSQTIQRYRDKESELVSKLALHDQLDPRRLPLSNALNSVRAEIRRETDKIAASIRNSAEIEAATVKQLEATVANDVSTSQQSSVVGSTLAALRSDVDAKQQMLVAFEKNAADQQRLEMSQAPLARVLYPATVIPSRHFGLAALVLGFLFGSLVSSAGVILRDVFNATIDSPLDLAIATGLPVLGSLPEIKGRTRAKAIRQQMTSETLRALCVTLRPEMRDTGEAVLITSCEGGEGKTTLAATMAKTYADDGFRVLLIDGDLRRPRLASVIGIRPAHTIEGVLAGAVPWTEAVIHCSGSGLDCLLASGRSRTPISAINSRHLSRLIEEGRRLYDFIILDSPPILRVADALLLAQRCQHVLFAVRAGFLSPDLVSQAVQRFAPSERSKTKTILVRVDPTELDKGDYYGGYGLTQLEAP